MEIPDLSKINQVYFTGIKGVGMTALACIAKDYGMSVSGSDTGDSFVTDIVLKQKGISWFCGFSPERISINQPDLVIYTAAHGGENNPEIIQAKTLNIPVISAGEALGLFQQIKTGISVAGVGGKTTTSAMLACILEKSGYHPSYFVGAGTIGSLPFPGRFDTQGSYFVCEADEYACSPTNHTPKFAYLQPRFVILTNVVFDHPDIYQDEEATLSAFQSLIEKIPSDGALIANYDSPLIQTLIGRVKVPVITYGESLNSDWKLVSFRVVDKKALVTIENQHIPMTFSLSIPGTFNAKNALAAFITAQLLGLSEREITQALSGFTGARRRFEKIYEFESTSLFDDYAHHPSEVKATIKSAKEWFAGKKIIVLFQPHTYSRTKALFQEFTDCFKDADKVIISDIYASAREQADESINSKILVEAINEPERVVYSQNLEHSEAILSKEDLTETVIFTMGAGDVFLWHDRLKKVINNFYGE